MPVTLNDRTLWQAIWGEESYVLLFVLLLGNYVILSLVDSPQWGGLARTLPVAVTVLFAIHTSHGSRALLRTAQAAVVLSLAGGIAQVFATSETALDGVGFLLVGLVLLMTPVTILRRVLSKDKVDVETLFAAVDVYIIIGIIFAAVFIGLATLIHPPQHQPFLAQPPPYHPPSDYVYLSFVTLTTVGFGDLTPLTNLARSVVVLEALMGQIFLVTLVARLVSLYSAEHRRFRARQPSSRPSEAAARLEAAEADLQAAGQKIEAARSVLDATSEDGTS